MAKFGNRVKETSTTTGTGTLDLDGSPTGFRAFSDEFTTGDASVYYLIVDDPDNPTDYEVGVGTFTTGTPNTLSRDTVESSSNADAKVSWTAGTRTVIATPTAGALELALTPSDYDIQVYTANDTWTKPAGLLYAKVIVVGGGGGGGGSNTTNDKIGAGGGGGGYASELLVASALGATETVTVGAAGANGTNTTDGGNGGTSSFGALLSATGGSGGVEGATGGTGGAGGAGSGGDINLTGQTGGRGGTDSRGVTTGKGGNAAGGMGMGGVPDFNTAGEAGQNYGGGGAGGHRTSTSSAGGAGAAGIVIVWEYL